MNFEDQYHCFIIGLKTNGLSSFKLIQNLIKRRPVGPFSRHLSLLPSSPILHTSCIQTFQKGHQTQNPKVMLKWSSNPVRRLRRFFSAVRCPPGGAVADVESISGRRSTPPPPPTVKRWSVPTNWCSFIGQITAPVMVYKSNNGVFTFLKVKGPVTNQTTSPFAICISMKGELARVSLQYLQKEQFVYVSGSLYSYNKIDSSYPHHVHYTVAVQQLNFVRTRSQNELPCKTNDGLKNEEMTFSASTTNSGSCDVSKEEWIRDQHILWQLFFANPFEWWDQRATKGFSKRPDFKHKSTGEALWIKSDDPPWVKKQLNLYDSKVSETNLFRKKYDHDLQGWKMQDFDHL